MAFKMKGWSAFPQKNNTSVKEDSMESYRQGNYPATEERIKEVKDFIKNNPGATHANWFDWNFKGIEYKGKEENKKSSPFDQKDEKDFEAFFPEPVELGGDLVSGLPPEDDAFSDIISAQYRANEQKEKGNSRGASMIIEAMKDNIRDYERKYKMSLDPDYIKKLSDQYIKSKK